MHDCHETVAKVAEHGLVAATVDNHGCGVIVQMVKVADVLAHVYLKRFSCVVGLFLGLCLEYLGWVGVTLLVMPCHASTDGAHGDRQCFGG